MKGKVTVKKQTVRPKMQPADAYLVAAAPELLAACELVADCAKGAMTGEEVWDRMSQRSAILAVLKAIEKAKGRRR